MACNSSRVAVTQSSSKLKFSCAGVPSFLSGQDPIPKQTPPILCVLEDTILIPKKCKSYLSLNGVRPLEHVVDLLEVISAWDDSRRVALRLEVLLQMRLLAQIAQLAVSISI